MAKITTITNPLTGQPAQVDQLDHTAQQIDDAVTRAIGYGLGTSAAALPSTNLDSITYNGWYVIGSTSGLTNPPPFGWGVLQVCARNYRNLVQEFKSGQSTVRRYCADGTWQPWEWVNPPMILGVEYRTTERIDGSPVYKKLVKLGSLPSNTTEDFPFTDDTHARCFEVCAQVGYFAYADGWRFTLPSGNYLAPVGVDNKIRITVNQAVDNSTADHPVTAIVKYIKV